MSNDVNSCANCSHFRQHYIKVSSQLLPVRYGHCVARGKLFDLMQVIPEKTVCQKWETVKIRNEERQKSIKAYLFETANRLQDIAMIVKDDSRQ